MWAESSGQTKSGYTDPRNVLQAQIAWNSLEFSYVTFDRKLLVYNPFIVSWNFWDSTVNRQFSGGIPQTGQLRTESNWLFWLDSLACCMCRSQLLHNPTFARTGWRKGNKFDLWLPQFQLPNCILQSESSEALVLSYIKRLHVSRTWSKGLFPTYVSPLWDPASMDKRGNSAFQLMIKWNKVDQVKALA